MLWLFRTSKNHRANFWHCVLNKPWILMEIIAPIIWWIFLGCIIFSINKINIFYWQKNVFIIDSTHNSMNLRLICVSITKLNFIEREKKRVAERMWLFNVHCMRVNSFVHRQHAVTVVVVVAFVRIHRSHTSAAGAIIIKFE